MYCLEDLKFNKLYKKQFMLPFIKEDKRHGSAILLLTPNYEISKELMNSKFTIDKAKTFTSYYIERDIMYTINHESRALEMEYPADTDSNGVVLEGATPFVETTDVFDYGNLEESEMNDVYCRLGDKCIFFNEFYDDELLTEAVGVNNKYKKLLYNDRIRNTKTMFTLYDKVKQDNPWINKTFISYERYHQFNLYIDLYYYNQAYLNNNTFTIQKSVDMYFEFLRRFINDKRVDNAGYTKKTVFIPVYGWKVEDNTNIFDYRKNLNPISVLFKKIRFSPADLNVFKGLTFVFFGTTGYFKFDSEHCDEQTYLKFMRFVRNLANNAVVTEDDDEEENSANAITADIVSDLENNSNVKIHNLTGNVNTAKTLKDADKAVVVKKISDVAKISKTKEDALDKLDADEDLKRIIADLQNDAGDNSVNMSSTRANRITNAQDSFIKQQLNGKSIKDMIENSNKPKELEETNIPIKTINNEWHHMKAVNFEKDYDLDADIVKCINSLSDKNKSFPVAILGIDKEDTSTSEDSIYTYTVKCEGTKGQRFQLKFDIPKFRDNRYMRLRGNEKIFSIEMPLLPISKTSDSRTQIATFYNKLFVDRYNTSTGKSNPYTDRLIKALSKAKGTNLKVVSGDNSRICEKYNLPIDYIDLAGVYSKIIFHSPSMNDNVVVYFNQDEISKIPGINAKNGLPLAMTSKGKVLYYTPKQEVTISQYIAGIIDDPKFIKAYQNQNMLNRATYSRVWILNTYIPTIVILAHDLGLIKAMDISGIKYTIDSKASTDFDKDYIKLKDGYINYKNTYDSMMIMNGLKDCDTEDISIANINSKTTWVDQLENFGGRNKSDGLDNFKDLMFDPITVDICKDYKLPTEYHEALVYASNLLVDNKFTKHIDISSNRYRTNEVVAAQFYRILSNSYREYTGNMKRGRTAKMTMKQSAVIDLILSQNTTSDLSVFQPLLEIETKNTISTKGVSGLNSERAYTLDKRGYDKSMVNVIAQSTNFAKNVGVNRQTTIDPNITGGRGYFKQSDVEDGNVTKTMGMTEALSPFVVSSDDPFRNFMTFTQTAKHGTPTEDSMPSLVTTGADEAMPYLNSDMYAFKAKKDGVVRVITPEYMLVEYKDKTQDYINLSEQTQKNSDGGFFITLQLSTDLKVGDKFKQYDILAWDKKSFSKKVGLRQLAYNMGSLIKVATMSTEDGFEDAGTCSEWLTHQMASTVVLMKSVVLPAQTNVLSIVKKGQKITEGEPLIIFQNAFDDADANMLLKNLNIDDNDITTIGRNIIKSKVTGDISDIKIYRACDLEDMSESLRKIVVSKENQVKKLQNIQKQSVNGFDPSMFDPVGKLTPTGKLKNADGCVLIEFYMRYKDTMSVGDKIVELNANKNIIMNVYDDKDAPYTDFRPNEPIDDIGSASSIEGRIVSSPIKTGALNKLLIELYRKCCDIYGVKWLNIHEIYDYFKK